MARLGSHGLDNDPLARPIMAVIMPPLVPVANEVQASGVRAGTSAILPHILGERVLGLSKD